MATHLINPVDASGETTMCGKILEEAYSYLTFDEGLQGMAWYGEKLCSDCCDEASKMLKRASNQAIKLGYRKRFVSILTSLPFS